MIISPLFILYFLLCLIFNQTTMFLIIISTILLHELGHLFIIKLFKGNVKKIRLSLVGGIIDVDLNHNFYSKKYYISNFLIAMGRNRYEWNYNTCFNNI